MKLSTTGAALGALLFTAAPALAQVQTPPTPPAAGATENTQETIVVTGYRGSLQRARDIKRDADIVKDVIVAEDMAKFPELNLAESLQRLPGVAINREAGEGRRVTLRGLGPDFTRVQLNGMEVLGNVDSAQDSRGQRSRDRAFDFNLFASELFSKVEVEKSYSAAQNEGGMAGTVGLFTGKPFDYPEGSKGALTFKLGTNTYTEDSQPRVVGLWSHNWNNKFGIVVSAAYSKRKTEEQGYNVYSPNAYDADAMSERYLAPDVGVPVDISRLSAADQAKLTNPSGFDGGKVVFQSGNRLSVWGADQTRVGLTAAVQWRPIDSLTLTFDALRGHFDMRRSEIHLATRAHNDEIIIQEGYTENGKVFAPARINAIKFDKTGLVTFADVDNVVFGTENRRERNTNDFEQQVLTGDWIVSDRLKIDGHIGHETSIYDIPIDDKLYLEAQGGLVASYNADGTGAHNVYKWDTTDPNNYTIRNLNYRQSHQSTEFDDAIVNGAYSLTDAFKLRGGLTYRHYETSGREYYNDGLYQAFFKKSPGFDKVTNYYSLFTDHDDQSWIIGDWNQMEKNYGLKHTLQGEDGQPTTDIENTFTVEENTFAQYLQVDYKTTLFGKPVRGNVGLRSYQTDTTSSGLVFNSSGVLTNAAVDSSYSGVLPAFNAAVSLTDNVLIRFAADKNINRPSLQSLAQTGFVSTDGGGFHVSNGNPFLKPFTSVDFDVAAEWYFGKLGMVTAGYFHKDIDNLISGETLKNVPYSVTGLPTSLAKGLTPSTIVADYSRPINLNTAKIDGIEFAAQTDFVFLPAPFDHLGAMANVTLIDSSVEGSSGSIPGLSDTNANATLYYETSKWGARVSANHRSKYQNSVYDGKDPTSEDGYDSTVYVDAAAFYNVSDRLRLTIDAINLTDETEVQYNSIYHRLHNETQSGTTVLLGASLQF